MRRPTMKHILPPNNAYNLRCNASLKSVAIAAVDDAARLWKLQKEFERLRDESDWEDRAVFDDRMHDALDAWSAVTSLADHLCRFAGVDREEVK